MTSEANDISFTSRDWQTMIYQGNDDDRAAVWSVPYHWENIRGARDPSRLFSELPPRPLQSTSTQPFFHVRIITRVEDSINQRLFNNSMSDASGQQWQMGIPTTEGERPGLARHEFKRAMSKMRSQIFCPSYPRQKAYKIGLFSRHNTSNHIQDEDEENDDGRECSICLEAFVPNEKLLVTPCNHMFHKDCLVPWVKDHDICPVCRSVFCEKAREKETNSPPNIANNNSTSRNMYNSNLGFSRSLFHI